MRMRSCHWPHGDDRLRAGHHAHHLPPLVPVPLAAALSSAAPAAPSAVLCLDVRHLPPLRVAAHGDAAVCALAVVYQAETRRQRLLTMAQENSRRESGIYHVRHLPRLSNGLEGFGRPSGQPASHSTDLSQLIVKGEKNEKVDDDDVHEKDIVRDMMERDRGRERSICRDKHRD